MKNPIKKLAKLKGKKRYMVLGLLALELLSLPAAAQIMQRVSFDISPIVIAAEIPTSEPGVSRYLVTSNAGFGVQANDLVGNVNVDVYSSGPLGGGKQFGASAQLPGPETGCAVATGIDSKIYLADQKIAASPGSPAEQAVIFEFRYDAAARPKFDFVAGADTASAPKPCSDLNI